MPEVHYTAHIPKWKRDEVEELKEAIKTYPVIGMVNMHGIPARQLQKMRQELRTTAVLKMTRNTLIERVLSESDKDVHVLRDFIEGQTALIFTELNPFKLYKLIERSKTPAPAKAGDIAPYDIAIEKGPTHFKPGPIIGELQSAGIPAAIEGGKVMIRKSEVIVRAGETISAKVADILTKLEIYPMEIGLNLRAVYEKGTIFRPDVLAINESKYFSDFMTAVRNAFNLSVNTAYPTGASVSVLLQKASIEAKNLATNAVLFEPDVAEALLAKAGNQATSLRTKLLEKGYKQEGD